MYVVKLMQFALDLPGKTNDLRRFARKEVRYPATVEAQHKLANAVVTNISEVGCQLRLVTPFPFSHYLSLTLYPKDGTAKWHIPQAEIRWAEKERAGLEFLSLSQEDKVTLESLCSRHVAFPEVTDR